MQLEPQCVYATSTLLLRLSLSQDVGSVCCMDAHQHRALAPLLVWHRSPRRPNRVLEVPTILIGFSIELDVVAASFAGIGRARLQRIHISSRRCVIEQIDVVLDEV